jgi:hypothetical protein
MMADRLFTFADLVNLGMARARERGTPGRIVLTPDPAEPGSVMMWIDDELLARGLDPAELEIASARRPDGQPLN